MSAAKFIPPKQNPLLTRLIQSIFVPVAYFVYKLTISISDRDIAKLKAISQHRVVYLPNHSNLDDGLVVFLLSTRLGQLFYYVVALEAFQGWVGKLMQTVGSYSIQRGTGDRTSIIETLKILQQEKCKLVIFPEGGCSYQNDTVIPFRSGAIELSIKAMDKLVKQTKTVPDFFLVPVSLKYTYPNADSAQIAESLEDLERALSIKLQTEDLDLYERLRRVAAQVLTNLETEYSVIPENETDWNKRIQFLKQHLLQYCEAKLELVPNPQLPNRERIYKIQSTLRNISIQDQKSEIDYQHLYRTTVRLLNFDVIYDGYVAARPTPARFFATLDRLEREVFQLDRPKVKGLRKVIVNIDSPINLKQYYLDLQSDLGCDRISKPDKNRQKQTIEHLTQKIQQIVQTNLQ